MSALLKCRSQAFAVVVAFGNRVVHVLFTSEPGRRICLYMEFYLGVFNSWVK